MSYEETKTFVGKKTKWFCNCCRTQTNHTCKAEHFPTGRISCTPDYIEDDGTKVYGIDYFYRFWTCDGCEDALLEQVWGGCKMVNAAGESLYSNTDLEIELHPHRTERSVPVRKFSNLPKPIANVYYETVFAHHHSLFLLCGIGLRTLIEAICSDQNITGKNLEERIDGLKKLLPSATAEKFHILRFIGNQAAHEFKEPEPEDLHVGIEICEDMLNFFYELDHRVSKLVHKFRAKSKGNSKS
jgi:hypothetical protein